MTRKPTPDQTRDASDRWEDEGGQAAPRRSAATEQRNELKRLSIKSTPMTVFEWGGFKYTNAKDAIAAAKRAG
jgi:hypothetical protein